MKILLFSILSFLFLKSYGQMDSTLYGYLDSVTIRSVEKKPVFAAGSAGWIKFMDKFLTYPKDAKKNKIEGTVVVRFIVEPNGHPSNIEVIKPLFPSLDKEAVELIKRSFWMFAVNNGQAVRYMTRESIEFKLKD